ncbi:MAG: DNA repair protein RecO [Burkholderiaceae bacterium]
MSEAAEATARRTARRRLADVRVDHQPGFVLHSYPWRETSLVVEFFSREFGRVALVARGAKRPTSQFRGLLSPFNPLAVSWSGRNDIKMLVRADWLGGMQPLRGDALLAAFYANELLVRLLARLDPHERLFGSYVGLLQSLSHETRHDAVLRIFELDLLQDIGYEVPLDRCADGEPIDADAQYLFGIGQGAQRLERGDADDGSQVSGRTLLAMATRRFDDERVAAEAKALLRRVIRYHLGGKPLNTRRILQDLRQL